MLSAEETLRRLGEEQALEFVAPLWAESMAALPSDGPGFLQPAAVRANRAACGFGPEVDEALLRVAGRILADPALSALCWHCDWRAYDGPEMCFFDRWPLLEKSLGRDAGVFYLLVGLAEAPRVLAHHQRLGLPSAVTAETCLEPYGYSLNHAAGSDGLLGLPRNQLFWLRNYVYEKYFRLGRFEFWLRPFEWEMKVLRHRDTRQVLALAPQGARFDVRGYCPGDEEPEQPGEWRAGLVETEGELRGVPISPWGRAEQRQVRMDKSAWLPALSQGDWVLDMHIPPGGGMSPNEVRSSLRRAAAFFPHYFPEMLPKAFVCWSWIYNPGLAEFLPTESNLVQNLGDAYLVPVPSGPQDGLGFIFYDDHFDPQRAPRKTSLQRATLAYLARGGRWRCGGMFYLMDDVDRLGTAVYQAAWPVL